MTETIASKLGFRDAFPSATLHCVLQVEEDTGEQQPYAMSVPMAYRSP